MPRSPRVRFAGAVYHVMSRGNERRSIYANDTDRAYFLKILSEVLHRYNVLCHAYCLMPNHYHLVLETPDANLSQAMQQLNGAYGRAYNRRHDRIGHLFQGRFKGVLVEKQHYLLELSRYVVLNPVRARIVKLPDEWTWSSFRATAGLALCPDFLFVDWLLACFDDSDPSSARRRYVEFVQDGMQQLESDAERIRQSPVLGGPEFVSRFRETLEIASSSFREIPRRSRFAGRPELAAVLDGALDLRDRDQKIREAHWLHGYTLSEIARHLGIHRTTVSLVARSERRRQLSV